jgi:hypothetical protein
MDEAEVEIVAEELAKLGGTAWYPGREPGPLLRIVHERYRDRARAAIAALDRFRASSERPISPEALLEEQAGTTKAAVSSLETEIQIGTTVIYRPEGDRRAYPCTVQKISNGFAFLVPEIRTGIGRVPIEDIQGPSRSHGHDEDNQEHSSSAGTAA